MGLLRFIGVQYKTILLIMKYSSRNVIHFIYFRFQMYSINYRTLSNQAIDKNKEFTIENYCLTN